MKIEFFLLLASFFLVAFASRRVINSDDLEYGKEFDLNDFEPDETDSAVSAVNDMFVNDYEYLRPVPRIQFDNAFRISLTIISIFKFMDSESIIYKLLGISSILTLPIQLQLYFGYCVKLTWPLKLEKIRYEHGGYFVSFNRWLLTPLLWITESLLLLSEEDYNKLHLPERKFLIFFFFIQALHYCGIIDLLISCLTGPEFNRNK